MTYTTQGRTVARIWQFESDLYVFCIHQTTKHFAKHTGWWDIYCNLTLVIVEKLSHAENVSFYAL